jgi:hypothetical protein
MERGDLGAGLTVLTSQIDFLVLGYSTTALDICKWLGEVGESLDLGPNWWARDFESNSLLRSY